MAAALFAAIACLSIACSEPADNRIRFGLPTAPVTLDARFATDAVSSRLVRLLHRPLVDFDAAANPIPDLGQWRQLSPTRYRFVLVPDATFNSSRPVSAIDVAATYTSVLDPATASPHRESVANIVAIEVVDERTIDFELARADVLFPGTLVIGVMAAADVEAGRGRGQWQESSGPFERVSWARDDRVVLRRRLDGALFEFITVKDVTVRALKLLGGELDITQGNIPPEVYEWLTGHAALRGQRVAGTTFSYLGFNMAQGPTSLPAVRTAIAHAIDRGAIVDHVFGGAARPAAAIFPPEHFAGAADLAVPAYDPVKARRLLAQSGFGEKPLVLKYKTSSDYFRLRIATILQSQLADVGIELDVDSLDWGTFYGDVRNGRFQLYALSWVGLRLPDVFRYAFHSESSPPLGANRGRYSSPVADALIEAAEAEPDRLGRSPIYRALEQHLLYDLPYVPLWFEDQLVVSRRDIHGYETNPDGRFDALVNTYRRAPIDPRAAP